MAALAAYDYPGNVRELRNIVERAIILTAGPEIGEREVILPERREPRAAREVDLLRERLAAAIGHREQMLAGGEVARRERRLSMDMAAGVQPSELSAQSAQSGTRPPDNR